MTPDEFFLELKQSYPKIPFYQDIQDIYDQWYLKSNNYKGKLYTINYNIFFKFAQKLLSISPNIKNTLENIIGGSETIDLFLYLTNGSPDQKICQYSGEKRPLITRKVKLPILGACSIGSVSF